jgi:hypothetical protein
MTRPTGSVLPSFTAQSVPLGPVPPQGGGTPATPQKPPPTAQAQAAPFDPNSVVNATPGPPQSGATSGVAFQPGDPNTGYLSTDPRYNQDPAGWTQQMWEDFVTYINMGGSNLSALTGASLQGLVPGMGQAAALLNDPYNIPDARLNQMLEGTELAFNRAGNQARQFGLSSGAGHGGVSQMNQGNIQMARGAEQARNLREFEQFRTALGDQRIGSLTDMFWSNMNQGEGVLRGTQTGGGSDTEDWLNYATAVLSLASAFCWVARVVYGPGDNRWLLARHYILNLAPKMLRDNYGKTGRKLAMLAGACPNLRADLRPIFDEFVYRSKLSLT